jgi:hypothetical protein
VNAHQPGKNHSSKGSDQGQRVILLADHLVVETEDVLPDETCRGMVGDGVVFCDIVHASPQEILLPHIVK